MHAAPGALDVSYCSSGYVEGAKTLRIFSRTRVNLLRSYSKASAHPRDE